MADNRSTITIQNIVDYARSFIALKQILGIGGISNEPGLSIANDILCYLLTKPFAWKFNRKVAPFFVTQGFIQDYLFAGAVAFTLNPVVQSGGQSSLGGGGAGIDLASNNAVTQVGSLTTVNCLQPHNFTLGQTVFMNNVTDANGNLIPGYNSIFTQNTVALSSVWSNGWTLTNFPTPSSFQFNSNVSGLAAGGAPGITDFAWLQDAAITDINNVGVPQPTGPIQANARIVPQYRCDETKEVAVMADLGNGVLQVRVGPCADVYNMSVALGYQMRPPLITKPSQTWAPWPDRLAYVLRAGMLAYAYDLTEKPEAEKQRKWGQFLTAAQSALGAGDAEQDQIGFAPVLPIMR